MPYIPLHGMDINNRNSTIDMLSIINKSRREQKEREAEQEEQEKESERLYLRNGLPEFDSSFQEEWENTASVYTKLTKISTRIKEISTKALSKEFSEILSQGLLSQDIVSMADAEFGYSEYKERVGEIHTAIITSSTYSEKEPVNPSKSSYELYRALREYASDDLLEYAEVPSSGKGFLVASVLLVILGATCNSACGTTTELAKASFFTVVFFWPAILSALIFIIKIFKRRTMTAKNDVLLHSKTELSKLLAKHILGDSIKLSDDIDVSSSRVLSAAAKELYSFFWSEFLPSVVTPNSESASGKDIYNIITTETEYKTFSEFDESYNSIKSHYEYMKREIMRIGLEIHEGHRVPTSIKSHKIQLLRCPSCGGPLATSSSTKCYYCGSVFR